MCAIAGIVKSDLRERVERSRLVRMADVQQHRGPGISRKASAPPPESIRTRPRTRFTGTTFIFGEYFAATSSDLRRVAHQQELQVVAGVKLLGDTVGFLHRHCIQAREHVVDLAPVCRTVRDRPMCPPVAETSPGVESAARPSHRPWPNPASPSRSPFPQLLQQIQRHVHRLLSVGPGVSGDVDAARQPVPSTTEFAP